MNNHQEGKVRTLRLYVTIAVIIGILGATLAFGVTGLLVTVFQRQQEARNPFMRVVEVTDDTVDPSVWGMNFPMQYDQYKRTVDMVRTRFGGSEAFPRDPSPDDPRSVTAISRVAMNERLQRMWAGHAFAIDYREDRGHAYMLEDQTFTQRHQREQFGNCMNCHSSVYTLYKQLGDGDIEAGFERLNPMPFREARELVSHPITCIDCHDPETMQLRITRPAFRHGIRAQKAAAGIPDYDVDTMATRQEMRSYVCAQCHVEYYFSPDNRRLTFPWHRGLRGDEILAYYDDIGFSDWTHADTGARMLKAQHPEYELWSQGIHAAAGVACTDCHMPYMRQGAMKISDHHVRSPLLNINRSCQTCHNAPEEDLLGRAERIQERTMEMLDTALDGITGYIDAIVHARTSGATDLQLAPALQHQRRATFLIDYVKSENSAGFHAPQESARILFKAMDYIRKGHIQLQEIPLAAPGHASQHVPESGVPAPL